MKKIKRRLCAVLVLLVVMAICPIQAFAAGPIDTDQNITLNISYKDGTKVIPNARFTIYRVADVDEYAGMTLTSVFAAYKGTVSGLADLEHLTQEQWLALASTLRGYVLRDGLTPVAEDETDNTGKLSFHGLKAGLYLIIGNRATTDDYYTYTPIPFMTFLPAEDLADNDWDYEVTVAPKFAKDYNPPEEEDDYITRKVLKIWDDSGYETIRPQEVIVQLLRDGKVYDTQTLNKDNNWRYAWDNLDADHEWDVIEKTVDGYAVTITSSGITFTVTNKYVAPITVVDPPVQKRITGDKPQSASTFTFVLSAKEASFPMPAGSTGTNKEITITGAGSSEFGKITFEKAGTYVYTVSEKNGGVDGYTYDTTVYTVTYVVTEKDGELSVSQTIKDNKGNTVSAIEFTNQYKTPGNKLPQTGILWWPVPALLCTGLVFIMIGVIRRRRCN